jgi:membrane protease YdiL (CAAX protease family)
VILLSEADNLIRFLLPAPRPSAALLADLARANVWLALMATVVLAPVTEEMFFRGLLLRGFLSRYRVKTAMAVSALLFALLPAQTRTALERIRCSFSVCPVVLPSDTRRRTSQPTTGR